MRWVKKLKIKYFKIPRLREENCTDSFFINRNIIATVKQFLNKKHKSDKIAIFRRPEILKSLNNNFLKQGLLHINKFAVGKHNIPREGSPGGGNGRGFKGDPMGGIWYPQKVVLIFSYLQTYELVWFLFVDPFSIEKGDLLNFAPFLFFSLFSLYSTGLIKFNFSLIRLLL